NKTDIQTNKDNINLKANTTDVNIKNTSQDDLIGANATKNTSQDVVINQNTAGIATVNQDLITATERLDLADGIMKAEINGKADQQLVDFVNTQQNAAIQANTDVLTDEVLRLNTANSAQDIIIAAKADTTYVDGKNDAQNLVIAGKANSSYVDDQNAAQNLVINT